MLMPKRVKHRRVQRGRMSGMAKGGSTIAFGDYALMTEEPAWITARQIEAGRVAASHFLRREGRLFIRIFPHKPVSGKPLETRMGKGKGEPEYWVAIVKPGHVIFEIAGVDEKTAKRALSRVAHKMPIRCRFISRKKAVA